MRYPPLLVRRAVILLAAGVLGCSSELLLPDPPDGGQNVALTKVDGDEQIGTVGQPLPEPLVVQVLTEREQPATGRKVAFVLSADPAAGEVSPDTAVTDDQGRATARWTLGTAPGAHTVVAQLVGGEAENQIAQFRAAATAGSPDTISAASAPSQPGRRAREVASAPVVHVVDRYGNPVGNAQVVWQVTAGEGQVEAPITVTDGNGNATVRWTLGDRIGVHKLTATIAGVTGSPVAFTATVLF
jgi:Big-like domain-containing protein